MSRLLELRWGYQSFVLRASKGSDMVSRQAKLLCEVRSFEREASGSRAHSEGGRSSLRRWEATANV